VPVSLSLHRRPVPRFLERIIINRSDPEITSSKFNAIATSTEWQLILSITYSVWKLAQHHALLIMMQTPAQQHHALEQSGFPTIATGRVRTVFPVSILASEVSDSLTLGSATQLSMTRCIQFPTLPRRPSALAHLALHMHIKRSFPKGISTTKMLGHRLPGMLSNTRWNANERSRARSRVRHTLQAS
jgi:hypothetical protein